MVKLRINDTELEAPEGSTILDAAENAGFNIPVLCYKKGLPHYSSCMVCMVKDKRTSNFIPSCSALVQDGMDIDISGDDVQFLRKKAIEMLLSEHRAECEAPCRVVCPAGYNIPLMNRLLAEKDYDAVRQLTESEIKSGEIMCTDCQGYCENACRRKKVDIPVSIRNMKMFIAAHLKSEKPLPEAPDKQMKSESVETAKKLSRTERPFTSRIGRMEPAEFQEWLKECRIDVHRVREITNLNNASDESESCMHCDCRAIDNCRLRDLAQSFKIKDPSGKLVNSPIVKKINHTTGLIFENAKCIKCGLCVRLCEQYPDEPGLCFLNRGFVSIISEPITEEFDNILKTKAKEVIEICPTGALSSLK
jgi:hypothetical protein